MADSMKEDPVPSVDTKGSFQVNRNTTTLKPRFHLRDFSIVPLEDVQNPGLMHQILRPLLCFHRRQYSAGGLVIGTWHSVYSWIQASLLPDNIQTANVFFAPFVFRVAFLLLALSLTLTPLTANSLRTHVSWCLLKQGDELCLQKGWRQLDWRLLKNQ